MSPPGATLRALSRAMAVVALAIGADPDTHRAADVMTAELATVASDDSVLADTRERTEP